MSSYQKTVEFWNDIFSKESSDFDHRENFPFEEIEKCLDWLISDGDSVIDFGCGNGKLLMRCLAKGAERGVGIDISPEGIENGKKLAKKNGIDDRTEMLVGDVVDLEKYDDNEFDVGILSNVIDNLTPEDSRRLIEEFKRVIKPGGKIFLKLNDHMESEELEGYNAEKISENFYREESGIYLWNLKDEDVKELLGEDLTIVDKKDVEFEEHDQINRLFYVKNE
ncbi:MAG: class I SAM-dependent methyltransferase [Candidatus Natronoplasma sp.]